MSKIEQGIFDSHEAIDGLVARELFGYLLPFDLEPTNEEMALWRCLPLAGQVVLISQYQRLCDRNDTPL
jgi:hypothetical protein